MTFLAIRSFDPFHSHTTLEVQPESVYTLAPISLNVLSQSIGTNEPSEQTWSGNHI
jgi:hypothetical protein